MDSLVVMLVIGLVGVLIVLPIWLIAKATRHDDDIQKVRDQVRFLENELRELRALLGSLPIAAILKPAEKMPTAEPAAPARMAPEALPPESRPVGADVPERPIHALRPLVVAPADEISFPADPEKPDTPEMPPFLPPPIVSAPVYAREETPREEKRVINWEQFMGAKLFAWLGGFALFLGVAFFVKYSFEHDLIPPQVRMALGFLMGAGLVVGGLRISAEKYRITSQTLVAAGIVSLYAVTFACGSIYHFTFFGPLPTFCMMVLVTTAAFSLAVRLNAQVVAILGILGGFLTPVLISTGHDNPVGLFCYIGLLVVGLSAVALNRGWLYLVPLGATGTVLMLAAWAERFYIPGKTGVAMAACIGFCALFFATTEAARRLGRDTMILGRTAIALPVTALCFALYFLGFPDVAAHAVLIFTFVLVSCQFLFALAWRENLEELVPCAAVVTAFIMVRWLSGMFNPQQAPVVVGVCIGFSVIYFLVYLAGRRLGRASLPVLSAAVAMPAVSLGFAFFLMEQAQVGSKAGLLFTFIFVSDALLLAVAWLDERMPKLHLVAGMAVFALLSAWSAESLTDALLPWALAASLVFAAMHTAFPIVLEKRRPASAPAWWNQLFPPMALLLMLFPIYKLEAVSLLVWPAMLLVDAIAIGVAVLSASLASVAAVLVLTFLAAGLCIFRIPVDLAVEPSLLLVIGGFAVFFFFSGLWLVRRLGGGLPELDRRFSGILGDTRGQIPAFSALLPFVLLVMVCARLVVQDPSAVFGLGLLLVILTLGLARLVMAEWLPACALAGMASVEFAWHTYHFSPGAAGLPLAWYAGFYLIFAAYPFAFRRVFARQTGPWAVSALSGVAHFWMVYRALALGWPNNVLGLVPAAFALAPMAGLIAILRSEAPDNPTRINKLAWFGGAALFFITLVFPIQFDRQWLTVSWALEGAALLWLFHRVPHPGLRATGAALLAVVFVRLALNPAVFEYHARSGVPFLNWYLYAYGVAIACLFAGGQLLAEPRQHVLGVNVRPFAYGMAIVLMFLLMNIEIADYFTRPGSVDLTFEFSGNFARDMCYTIGWALFALGLLAAGIWREQKVVRYAAIALLSVALLKLFFHDLARLEALYRIGALFAVAVIAILASFAYQRFLPNNDKSAPPQG